MRQDSPGLLALTATLCALTFLVGGACGGSDDPATTTSGTGGAGVGGDETIGGFMTGPTGSGGGMTGGGGEGGTGEVTNVWGTVLGGTGTVFPRDVAIDASGNVVIVGTFSGGDVNFGGDDLINAGSTDIFVLKLDGDGNHLWSKSVGGGSDEGAQSVDVDSSGNILLCGTFKGSFAFTGGPTLTSAGSQFSDAFLAKLDPDGGHLFSARYGIGASYGDDGNGVAADPNDNILFTGRFQSSADFGGGTISGAATGDIAVFLAKYGSSGAFDFANAYGDTYRQEGLDVAAASDGAIGLAGYSWGNVDFGGGELVSDQPDTDRAMIARFDDAGNHLFSALGTGGASRATGVAFAGGDLVVGGNFKTAIDFGEGEVEAAGGNDDVFVGRFDDAGQQVFLRRFGDAAKDQVAGIATDSQGFTVVAGTFDGELKVNYDNTLASSATLQDAFLMRLGPTGNGYAGVNMLADNSAQAEGVAVDPNDDAIVVVGRVSGSVDFGDGAQSGTDDMFVAKFAP